ncbi:sensor domain-containing diguanylate cyclase [Deinococcus radiotolerans]|uniref:sensor domain-containing diguanylate cyclase n=1 Tax=Deinococcus radiotolerans TaxID=1309407 RepID=UPI001668480D|nr:diguanylate cyclase [Deinococcus radiotolerans]
MNSRWTTLCRSLLTLLALLPGLACASDARPAVQAQTPQVGAARLYRTPPGAAPLSFPASGADLAAWQAGLTPVSRVRLTGDDVWVVLNLRNPTAQREWVFDPHGTLMEFVDARVYRPGQPTQVIRTGYRAEHPYMLHYGADLTLNPGEQGVIVARVRSPYFASQPEFSVPSRAAYRRTVSRENALILLALGALLTLAMYNLFVYAGTRNRSFLYYAAYMLAYCAGWAFTFHLPADVFGWHDLRWHYVWFFLLPILNTLFYRHFLQLRARLPLLDRLSFVNLLLPLTLLPTAFVLLPYAHVLATGVIAVWLLLALISGVASWRQGFEPARFFVLGLLALLVPAAIILPGNVGLTPDVPFNSELFTLLGGTLDGLLLAFALADLIRLLSAQNRASITQLQQALHLARTDLLTGLNNRYAFEQAFGAPDSGEQLLIVIDLDGLKQLNDRQGHRRGDDLLRDFAAQLRTLEDGQVSAYRLGGDEFALLAPPEAGGTLAEALRRIEAHLQAGPYPQSGVSFGTALTTPAQPSIQTFEQADQRMYTHKQAKKRHRDTPPPLPI